MKILLLILFSSKLFARETPIFEDNIVQKHYLPEIKTAKKEIEKSFSKELNSHNFFSIESEGQKFKSVNKIYPSGVVKTNEKIDFSVQKIPLLDIGKEKKIKYNSFKSNKNPIFNSDQINFDKYEVLDAFNNKKTAQLLKYKKNEVKTKYKNLEWEVYNEERISKLINSIKLNVSDIKPVELKSVDPLLQNEFELILAQKYYKNQECRAVVSLTSLIHSTTSKAIYNEAQKIRSICLYKLKFHTEAIETFLKLIKENDKNIDSELIDTISRELPVEFGTLLAEKIHFDKITSHLKNKGAYSLYYQLAKAHSRLKNFKTATEFANLVPIENEFYPQSQFIIGMALFSANKIDESYKYLIKLSEVLSSIKYKNENFLSLLNINLARLSFQLQKYEISLTYFDKINKNHPLWVQGIIEKGWVQLLINDEAGSIGNMFSLQAPSFRDILKPDSLIISTVGFLNLCQYGDAYKKLGEMESKYVPYANSIRKYIRQNERSHSYYSTIVSYLKNPSQKEVNGLQYQIIRDMAKQKDFIDNQKAINNRIDERDGVKKLLIDLQKDIFYEKSLLIKAEIKFKQKEELLKETIKNQKLVKHKIDWRNELNKAQTQITFHKLKIDLLEQGLKITITSRTMNEQRIDLLIKENQILAGKSLRSHLVSLSKSLDNILENNEFLRYEIFAGSGEDIRFKIAGGEVQDKRIPSSVKPTSKSLQWSFSGEYWEDEIGHYRSSIKNNCPQE